MSLSQNLTNDEPKTQDELPPTPISDQNDENSKDTTKDDDDIEKFNPSKDILPINIDTQEKLLAFNAFNKESSNITSESVFINQLIAAVNVQLLTIKRKLAILEHKRNVLGYS
jgi:hypothetical protein